jgi:RNA polymerase sigma factor (sigma-70 family)
MATQIHDLEPLVVAAAAGDREAFGRLVTATSGVVSSISLAILRDLDLSRDVAQDVFLAAWRDLRKLRSPASFLPWLRQLARNRAHHVLRSHVRARRREAESVAEDFLNTINDPGPSVAAQMVAREEVEALARALDALPDDTREVLTLFYREGQSVAQVSALLDLSDDAVKKRLSRARATLREAVLDTVGQTVRATAPGAAFTAAVMGGLTIAAPATASASALAVSKGAAQAGLGAKFLVIAGSALPGALGGVAGVLGGTRSLLREARDDKERRSVRRFRLVASLTVVVFALGFPVGAAVTQSWRVWSAINFALFIATLALLYTVWLPRILKRRFEAEMREDPVRALARRRHERRMAIVGWTLGLTCGTLGLVLGMWLSG